jgi:transposase
VDRHSDEWPSSPEDQDWERKQIEKVAARFPRMYREDLKAELALTLLLMKRRRRQGIRNPRAYLAQGLWNRATSLAKKWRLSQSRETSAELHFEAPGILADPEETALKRRETLKELSKVRRRLDAESYAFLELLADVGGNQSRLARLLGKHRNTIGRRLRQIRRRVKSCPIRNVSGRLRLTPEQREHLNQVAQASNARLRDRFKARLILALASGQSYAQIEQALKTTAPTISRWKHRFEKNAIEGLKSKYQGRKPRTDVRIRLANWLQSAQRGQEPKARLSCRRIAHALGISKSTVQRVLKEVRMGH